MGRRKAVHEILPFFGKGQENLPAVVRRHFADHRLPEDELVDDTDGTMVPDLELFCQVPDGELALG